MTELIIDDTIAERLREIAQQENRPLDTILRSMPDSYTVSLQPSDWSLTMAKMAETDTDIVWNRLAPDLSERSREILETEFGDYLLSSFFIRQGWWVTGLTPFLRSIGGCVSGTPVRNANRSKTGTGNYERLSHCLMALSERLNITQICTYDRHDFSMFCPIHGDYLQPFGRQSHCDLL
ncbi:MAG: hypothetical protein ACYDBJ_17495 [Aggregatilineales bacterium]